MPLEVTAIDHIYVAVRDLERSVTFYDPVMKFLENTFGFQVWDSDVYYVTSLPSEVRWPMVAAIAAGAFILTGLATIYPALRASKIEPAEALRYE